MYVRVKTREHSASWAKTLNEVIAAMPEILECHRIGGDVDYLLKVIVPDIAGYDRTYKELIGRLPSLPLELPGLPVAGGELPLARFLEHPRAYVPGAELVAALAEPPADLAGDARQRRLDFGRARHQVGVLEKSPGLARVRHFLSAPRGRGTPRTRRRSRGGGGPARRWP